MGAYDLVFELDLIMPYVHLDMDKLFIYSPGNSPDAVAPVHYDHRSSRRQSMIFVSWTHCRCFLNELIDVDSTASFPRLFHLLITEGRSIF